MNSSPALLYRPALRPDESLPSLLIRLARENFYHSPTMVAQLCRERLTQPDNVTQPGRADTYRVLAGLTNIEADELYLASVQRFASTVIPPPYEPHSARLPSGKNVPVLRGFFLREQTWPETDVQFCPLCLQEAAYHRVNWMPLAVAVCLRHQCLLAHGCPNCAEDIRVRDILDVQCPNCGLALTEAPVVSIAADEFGLFSQAVLQAWLGLLPPPCADALAALPGYPPAVLYRVLEGLRCAVMRVQHGWDYLYAAPSGVGVPLFPCASKGDITPAKAYILYATAFRALVDWPRGFHEFLEAYRRRDWRLVTGCIQEDYGYLYISCLEKLWRHPAYRFVQEAFDQYLLDNYPITPTLARLRRAQDDPAFSMTG